MTLLEIFFIVSVVLFLISCTFVVFNNFCREQYNLLANHILNKHDRQNFTPSYLLEETEEFRKKFKFYDFWSSEKVFLVSSTVMIITLVAIFAIGIFLWYPAM